MQSPFYFCNTKHGPTVAVLYIMFALRFNLSTGCQGWLKRALAVKPKDLNLFPEPDVIEVEGRLS